MPCAFQREFAAAVLDPARPVPAGVAATSGGTTRRRFAVYRNNVIAGLVSALRTRFPVLQAILGEECFVAAARVFATAHPPRSPLMMFYGDALADFLAGFPPLAHLPYLADMAKLEAARTHAHHAADACPVEPAALQALEPDVLFAIRVRPHPSLRVIRSAYPVATIWAMNSGEIPLGPIDACGPEDALVVRHGGIVRVHRLPAGAAALLGALTQRASLGEAVAAALAARPDLDLPGVLALAIGCGALVAPDTSAQEGLS
jgi:hypothetical protein